MASRPLLLLLLIALLPLALAGTCGTTSSLIAQPPGTVQNYTLCSGGLERSFLLFVPDRYAVDGDEGGPWPWPWPLLISFHGGDRTATDQLNLDLFTSPAFNNETVVAYPQGVNNTWQGVPGHTVDDVQFVNDLIDLLLCSSHLAIDASRIWATGKSDGGGMVGVLACDTTLSQRIAAFAPVSGAFYTTVPAAACHPDTVAITCNPGRGDVAVVEFHGGADDTIPYAGGPRRGVCLPSIPHYLQAWALRDGLPATNVTTRLTGDTLVHTFGCGATRGLVTGYLDTVIGHDWPATVPNEDNSRPGHAVASFNASPIIREFVGRYSLTPESDWGGEEKKN